MTAPAYPGDAQSRTAADLTDEQAAALGRVVTRLDEKAVERAARAINDGGYTCAEGGDSPGRYDECPDCKRVCDDLARSALAAALADRANAASAIALGRVVGHMKPAEGVELMARMHGLPMGEVPPVVDLPARTRMVTEPAGAAEREALDELIRWRAVDCTQGVFTDAGILALARLRDVADRLGLAS